MTRGRDAQRWMLVGSAAMTVAVLGVWQHSYEATLARHKAQLLDTIDRLQREVDRMHLDVVSATARSDVRGTAETDLGLRPASSDQIVVITIPRDPAARTPADDATVAELGRSFLDALLPPAAASSRVRAATP